MSCEAGVKDGYGGLQMTNNDTVICSGSSEQMKESLERCRYALERREIKVRKNKQM